MTRTILFAVLWSLAASIGMAQEPAAPAEAAPAPPSATETKVFALQHAQATEVAEVLKQVYDRGPTKIVPDARTNSVIVTGPEAQVREIEALLLKLDEAGQVPQPPAIQKLLDMLPPLRIERAMLLTDLGDKHPKVTLIDTKISVIQDEIRNLESRATPGSLDFTAMLQQYQAVIEEIQLLEDRLIRMERSGDAYSVGHINDSRLGLRQAEAKLADIESRIAAPNNQLKARLLRVMVNSLCQWRKTPDLDKSKVAEVEAMIPGIMAQLDQSPAAAQKAALELADRLDGESFASIESVMTLARKNQAKQIQEMKLRGDNQLIDDTEVGRQEDRLAALRRTQEARKSLAIEVPALPASTSSNTVSREPSRSPNSRIENGGSGASVVELRKDYEAADAQAHRLAEQLQQSPDAAKKAELRQAVQRAFTARQSLLRAELLEMQTRLLQTQRSIEMRERISDQIIQRRVEDLLNPQLKWKGSGDGSGNASPQANLDPRRRSAASSLGLRLSQSVAVPQDSKYHGGLLVESVAPGSPADQQGVKAGDILVGLGTWETTELPHVDFILSQRRTDPLKFYILRGAETLYGHMVPGGPPL